MLQNTEDFKVLIVDDEPFHVDLLDDALNEHNLKTLIARNGTEAWEMLSVKGNEVNAVLLDRKMPDMDGIEVLKRIKEHPRLQHLPVILQTVKAEPKDVLEGVSQGAFYYLTKPYDLPVLVALVKSAREDIRPYLEAKTAIEENRHFFNQIVNAELEFQTLNEVNVISSQLAKITDDMSNVSIGLKELMLNAVEHGNLGITYEEKKELVINSAWHEEVERRLSLEENKNKLATVKIEKNSEEIVFIIEDEGSGFNWEPFFKIDPRRAFDPNGRGIYMASTISFDSLEYVGNGNQVIAKVNIT